MAANQKNVTANVCESSHDAVEKMAEEKGSSKSKAAEKALELGLEELGYLDKTKRSRVDPILSELGRFAGYSASVLLGVHFASSAELVEYAVVLLAVATVALGTQRVSHHIDALLERGVA